MASDLVIDAKTLSIKNLAFWLYLAHGASLIFSLGMLSWLPLIVSYLKRGDAQGTFVYSHHSWQIRSFWWYFGWSMLAGILFLTIVGIPLAWVVGGIAWVWYAYRVIKGVLRLNDNVAI